jgi:hypothetical protein
VRWCDLSGFGGAEGHFTSPFAAFSSHVLLLFASILHPVFLLRSLQYDVTLYAACKAASLCYSAVGCTAEGVPKWTARTFSLFPDAVNSSVAKNTRSANHFTQTVLLTATALSQNITHRRGFPAPYAWVLYRVPRAIQNPTVLRRVLQWRWSVRPCSHVAL